MINTIYYLYIYNFHFLLLITHYSLLITYYSLLINYYLLLTLPKCTVPTQNFRHIVTIVSIVTMIYSTYFSVGFYNSEVCKFHVGSL